VSAITIGEVAPLPDVPSDPFTVNPEIAFPPVAGAEKAIEFWLTPAVGVGADIVAGTVVTVTEEDVVPVAVPAALEGLTKNVYAVFEASPSKVYEAVALPVVTVYVAGVLVIV
jgi:hypothetical protein